MNSDLPPGCIDATTAMRRILRLPPEPPRKSVLSPASELARDQAIAWEIAARQASAAADRRVVR